MFNDRICASIQYQITMEHKYLTNTFFGCIYELNSDNCYNLAKFWTLWLCTEFSRNRHNNIGLELLWAKMKVMQLSRCCLFNKNCLLRSASSNFCRGKSENLTKASTKIIPSRWITSGPSKIRTLTCPQNIDGGFSRAPIIGRFKAFLFRLKYPKFKFWDAVDGCKEVGHCILLHV